MKTKNTFFRIVSIKWMHTLFVTIVLSTTTNCYSQNYKTNDTISVDEVVVSGESIDRFQAGVKIEKIESDQLELSQDGNLESLILRHTPIAIKSQGSGLSTIRMRGTSPNHTSVNFGGINLNSLTLGHSNMSNFPMFLFDELAIQYGSSSSVNGSGNIGGAIHLGLKNYWTKGLKIEARIAHGSFGEQLYGTKVFLGNGKFESVSRAYYYYKTNNFKFTNNNIRNVEQGIFSIKDQQRRANIEDYGLIQEFNYRISNKETIKIINWFQYNWNNTQSNMASNLDTFAIAIPLANKNARLWGEYNKKTNILSYYIGAGYVYDYQNYNNNTSLIKTQRIIGQAHIEHNFNTNASYKIGIKASRIKPEMENYIDTVSFEDRADIFVSYRHNFFKRLKVTLNIRKGHVSGYQTPYTPSVGIAYLLFLAEEQSLNIISNAAYSYRVASLNDRFYDDGINKGNPYINPEKGMNYELGVKWDYCSTKQKAKVYLASFYMDIDDWILWLPEGSSWQAQNNERVISKGLELKTEHSYNFQKIGISQGINLALTSSQRIEDESKSALYRQIEYTPLLSGTFFSSLNYNKLFLFTVDGSYTHWQYTDKTPENILDEYLLLNTSISYNLNINKKEKLTFITSINNITNKNYQSTINYAMPGINYRLTIKYNFN